MLNSAEHEIFSANKYENANDSYLLAEKFSCSAMFSKKEFAVVSNVRFISRKKFMLSSVEHEKIFITSGPGVSVYVRCPSLRKHAYSNIPKILPPKNENFQIKYSDIFHILAQNID